MTVRVVAGPQQHCKHIKTQKHGEIAVLEYRRITVSELQYSLSLSHGMAVRIIQGLGLRQVRVQYAAMSLMISYP